MRPFSLGKEKAGARLPTFKPPAIAVVFLFDDVEDLFLVTDAADFLAAGFFDIAFVFADVLEAPETGFFVLLDWLFEGMNSSS
jgi:hypothetical protein